MRLSIILLMCALCSACLSPSAPDPMVVDPAGGKADETVDGHDLAPRYSNLRGLMDDLDTRQINVLWVTPEGQAVPADALGYALAHSGDPEDNTNRVGHYHYPDSGAAPTWIFADSAKEAHVRGNANRLLPTRNIVVCDGCAPETIELIQLLGGYRMLVFLSEERATPRSPGQISASLDVIYASDRTVVANIVDGIVDPEQGLTYDELMELGQVDWAIVRGVILGAP